MADGTTIYADVHFPTDEKTGEAASGSFPRRVGFLRRGRGRGERPCGRNHRPNDSPQHAAHRAERYGA
jgi:hypothetical protein